MIQAYNIKSINVAKPMVMVYKGSEIETAINKKPIEGPVYLSSQNLEGDGQGDLVHHGGEDKAICVYSYDHYSFWEDAIGKSIGEAAFGENITVEGLYEKDIFIGDIFELGEAVIQVSQPREPCSKIGMKHNRSEFAKDILAKGFTGFYCRVLKEGIVSKENKLLLSERNNHKVTIEFANNIMFHNTEDKEALTKLLSVSELSNNWRETLQKRL
ncbi:MOSC domain-containing protein [Bacillus sp. FJAT-45350]|uniref:MOSC domain-containing protein n=1 Tax=Bacillus sp. FJAT-45350 TaxID=2011014 RepID=UPI00211C4404|nr:MOSC domain-containing protein [Bacillus sp. FJAT-45350]